ncbi:hypothetical protein QBC37DRAFT_99977 [Rhypophila decipiens]|uniref:Anucleate primary sterigmata protein B n=1 Tax=Rhypophila decipiens TaxID=261697 RepID=A0AAN6XV06_9PEZI|nr:hypothetical protein QBC37DRAFT_99977 [Rhypophila decipiens]
MDINNNNNDHESSQLNPGYLSSRPPTAVQRVDANDLDDESSALSVQLNKLTISSPEPQPAAAVAPKRSIPALAGRAENIPPPPQEHARREKQSSEPAEASFNDGPSSMELLRHSDSQAEIAVRQHLQDIESSFSVPPPLSPIPGSSNNGIDDTYLFDSPSKKHVPRQLDRPIFDADYTVEESEQGLPLPATVERVRGSEADETNKADETTSSHTGNSTSVLEAFSSSPTAAAAARSILRAVSQATIQREEDTDLGHESTDLGGGYQQSQQSQAPEQYEEDLTRITATSSNFPEDQSQESTRNFELNRPSIPRHRTSDQNLYKLSVDTNDNDAGNTPGHALKASKQRPNKYLHTRQGSQRSHSSVSSFMTDPESDVTVGTNTNMGMDYALQSGGAVPSAASLRPGMAMSSRSMSNDTNLDGLSRSISMGSMASGIEQVLVEEDEHEAMVELQGEDGDVTGPLSMSFGSHGTGAGLGNSGLMRGGDSLGGGPNHGSLAFGGDVNNNEDMFQTPKAATRLAAPTDTVIARHVRDVQVPESLANEYMKGHGTSMNSGLMTPLQQTQQRFGLGASSNHGASTATNTTTRNGARSLTLKEQSSTIERLSKENFDLKLKVMFLSDRLDKLSEEGIKEMISENVELKTGLAVLQRDNKVLRRRVKELEKQLRDEDLRPGTAGGLGLSDDDSTGDREAFDKEREEEILYLRERVEEFMSEIERLREENLNKEAERRRMESVVRTLGERTGERMMNSGEYGNASVGREEEADVWKDLLEQETARREQGDEDNRRLREEVFRLKQEVANANSGSSAGHGAMHHTTNIYNIRKGQRERDQHMGMSPTRPTTGTSYSGHGGDMDTTTGTSVSSTLVDELRRESEQLRHENAELRREVGAQTSMLTSRNREKERLYQEIEDLKMAQRRGGPAPSTIDSLLDRSASRAGAHERSHSRTSGGTRGPGTLLEEADREELENKLAELRDKNNDLKLQNQDLQRELETCMADFENTLEAKTQAEELVAALQEDLDTTLNDLMVLQAERDEALQEHANLETEFEALRKEAQDELDAMGQEAGQREAELERLSFELNERSENFDALQEEMRKMSDALVRLEDEQEGKLRRIQQLEQDLGDANKELEDLETKLLEANDKANRLSVQQESSQGEIAFLREEQEGDKIRIGDLEAALANAEQSIREEKDRSRELEQRLATERRQREIVANREKEDVQQFVNELNREASAAKDEARRLRKNLTSREVEATEWKERLIELENNLREALGDLNGTRSSLLKSIAKLQRDLENTVRDLENTKASLNEKDRIIKQRDARLESHAQEYGKLKELFEKEKQAHRNTKNQFETFQKTHQHVTRTVSTQEARIYELEAGKTQDKKRISMLEANFKDQLTERNNLLLVLWTRLSSLCGTDWAHDNSLINGRALPSLESVATMLPGFSKNLLAAVKTIETMIGSFQGKIKSVERDLWREYQTLESHLEMRTKKLDRMEAIVRNSLAAGTLTNNGEAASRLARLEEAYRQLRVENHTLRSAAEVRARTAAYANADGGGDGSPGGSPSPSVPTGPKGKSRLPRSGTRGGTTTTTTSSSRTAVSRTSSSTRGVNLAAEEMEMADGDDDTLQGSSEHQQQNTGTNTNNGNGGSMDSKWMLRLRDLEYKLKAEREARIMDRGEAMKRINASESENLMLKENLEREKRRQGR